ncbi:hypothetical protein CVT26_000105 [Gymnopilus dilepis]|uniref:Uncharacterized protein n=1 Tax=Gymnopilus dilepis TaxID=231916 RepID=A0A409X5D2_9AGAR|nr:hypothetical protein CVT26_000105 [Gymnopilus dilepis]
MYPSAHLHAQLVGMGDQVLLEYRHGMAREKRDLVRPERAGRWGIKKGDGPKNLGRRNKKKVSEEKESSGKITGKEERGPHIGTKNRCK